MIINKFLYDPALMPDTTAVMLLGVITNNINNMQDHLFDVHGEIEFLIGYEMDLIDESDYQGLRDKANELVSLAEEAVQQPMPIRVEWGDANFVETLASFIVESPVAQAIIANARDGWQSVEASEAMHSVDTIPEYTGESESVADDKTQKLAEAYAIARNRNFRSLCEALQQYLETSF